ncbi:protein YgfX [Pseudoalteromonas pernae]|uniref:protein YgfX n=1 Tax=Pseudoalteromonas pernae TaxID=3118054 RepID=UPI003242FF7D
MFALTFILFFLSNPSLPWALICAPIMVLAYVHFYKAYRCCWPHQGMITVKRNRIELRADETISGVILPQSQVFSGLVYLQIRDDLTTKRRRVLISEKAMQPEHFRALARAVLDSVKTPKTEV